MVKNCKIHGDTKHKQIKNTRKTICGMCRSEAVSRRRRKVKVMAVEYKGGCCEICGYNKCLTALTFHHKDPEKKDFSIAAKGHTISWDKVKTEIDKCMLLCHNCHAEEHERMFAISNPQLNSRLNAFSNNTGKVLKHCIACKKEIWNGSKCWECYVKSHPTKIKWPKNEKLLSMVKKSSYCAIGRLLGVSDNAVRKRLKRASLI